MSEKVKEKVREAIERRKQELREEIKEEKKEERKEDKVIDFDLVDIRGERESIDVLLNKTFVIVGFEKRTSSRYGDFYIIRTDDGKEYYTFSKVLMKQLDALKEYFDKGYKVRVKLVKQRRYLTFTKPD
jgi:Ni,Fe-hydrogenase maturation factor